MAVAADAGGRDPGRNAGVLLLGTALLLAAAPAQARRAAPAQPTQADRSVECALRLETVRGFQGLFEWMPGPFVGVPERMMGGRWFGNATVIDLAEQARQWRINPVGGLAAGDVYALTTLRNVHAATEVRVIGMTSGEGLLPAVIDAEAEIVAMDPALDLALLRCRQPAQGFQFAPGVVLSADGITQGMDVLRVHAWNLRLHPRHDTIWTSGSLGWNGTIFWLPALPVWWTQEGVPDDQAGAPLLEPDSRRLVGILANEARQVRNESNGSVSWQGDRHVIPADRIATFLRSYLRAEPIIHGTLPDGGPVMATVDPRLQSLLGLAEASGVVVMQSWPEDSPILLAGDVILRSGERRVGAGGFTLGELAFEIPPGSGLQVTLRRGDETTTAALPVVELLRPSAASVDALQFAGAWFQDPIDNFRRPGDDQGVVVVHVEPGSPAEAAQLSFRMVVHSVIAGGKSFPIETVEDLRRSLQTIVMTPDWSGELALRVGDVRYPNAHAGLCVLRLGPQAVDVQAEEVQ